MLTNCGLLISVNVQEELWAWLCWGGEKKGERGISHHELDVDVTGTQVVSDIKTHHQLLCPSFCLSHRLTPESGPSGMDWLIDWFMPVGHAHHILFVLLWTFSSLWLFRERKVNWPQWVGHYWPLLLCDQTESNCSGDNCLIGAGERSLSGQCTMKSLVLNMRCYRAGDGFFKKSEILLWHNFI